jgi:hypothetical protein
MQGPAAWEASASTPSAVGCKTAQPWRPPAIMAAPFMSAEWAMCN